MYLSDKLTYIGQEAFVFTTRCSKMGVYNTSTRRIEQVGAGEMRIGPNVTTISHNALGSMHSIDEVYIPNNVTYIGHDAFLYCNFSKVVTPFIGSSRTATGLEGLIGWWFLSPYSGCDYNWNWINSSGNRVYGYYITQYYSSSATNYVYIPTKFKTLIITDQENISFGALGWVSSLTTVILPFGKNAADTNDYLPYDGSNTEYLPQEYSEVDSSDPNVYSGYKLKWGTRKLKSVDHWAFRDMTGLQNIYTPSTLQTIGDHAFYNDTALANVWINGTKTGNHMFDHCTNLQNADASKVGIVEDYAFYDCNKLRSVALTNATRIDPYAFMNDTSLQHLVATNVTRIETNAFRNCTALQDATLDNVEYINANAFYGDTTLRNVQMDKCTEIAASVFEGATNLKTVEANKLTTIGNRAFYGCISLDDVSMDSLEYIGDYAFYNNNSLKEFELAKNSSNVDTYNIFEGWVENSVAHGVIHIGAYAFAECDYFIYPIKTYTPGSACRIEYIGDHAFYNDDRLGGSETNANYNIASITSQTFNPSTHYIHAVSYSQASEYSQSETYYTLGYEAKAFTASTFIPNKYYERIDTYGLADNYDSNATYYSANYTLDTNVNKNNFSLKDYYLKQISYQAESAFDSNATYYTHPTVELTSETYNKNDYLLFEDGEFVAANGDFSSEATYYTQDYVQVSIIEDDFVENMYYTISSIDYSLANSFSSTNEYYTVSYELNNNVTSENFSDTKNYVITNTTYNLAAE